MGIKLFSCITVISLALLIICNLNRVYYLPEIGKHKFEQAMTVRLKGPLQFNDEQLLSFIREKCFYQPTQNKIHSSKDNVYSTFRIVDNNLELAIDALFNDVYNGFFVEAGAMDGVSLSNTLKLEKNRNWTGLLVEPDKKNFRALLSNDRRGWKINACLSLANYPHQAILSAVDNVKTGNIKTEKIMRGQSFLQGITSPLQTMKITAQAKFAFQEVQCFPLSSLIMALGRKHVDFISLDVEGAEEHVLHSFPWDEITVEVWLVEHYDSNRASPGKKIIDFFHTKGYKSFNYNGLVDYIFIDQRSSLLINKLKGTKFKSVE